MAPNFIKISKAIFTYKQYALKTSIFKLNKNINNYEC